MKAVHGEDLPGVLDQDSFYILTPRQADESFYRERIDRNIGWVSPQEQEQLRNTTVGIAGCGGMGGLIAQTLLRAGIGRIKIADCELFDASNMNRQFGATRETIGHPKASATARALRRISDDSEIHVYPQGIGEATVESFLEGCDIVCDEIEFWVVGARILLHQRARAKGIPVLNCNTVGFGTRLFLFTPEAMAMEDMLALDYAEACQLERRIAEKTVTPKERARVLASVAMALVPEPPSYTSPSSLWANRGMGMRLLAEKGKAPIFGTNPVLATGFLADHLIFQLLKNSEVRRGRLARVPPAPGYLYFDAGLMKARVRPRRWYTPRLAKRLRGIAEGYILRKLEKADA